MRLTDTRQKRLVIIVMVAVAIIAMSTTVRVVTSRSADRQADSFARSVEAKLRQYERDDLDELLAEQSRANWEGRPSPLLVDGRVPERFIEVRRDTTVARYRVQAASGDRCVDALWRDSRQLVTSVNECETYERPGR